jgi:hypothetical protein
LACYVLDQAVGLWWRTLFGTLGVRALQALMIVGGLRVLLDPDWQLVIGAADRRRRAAGHRRLPGPIC